MTRFRIKKGKHSNSNFWSRLLVLNFNKKLTRLVTFGKECWYPEDLVLYSGFNKLLGVSYILNHQWSGRIVWMPDFKRKDYIKLYTYVYDAAERLPNVYLGSVKVDELFYASVEVVDKGYKFKFNSEERVIEVKRPKGCFKQYPYFGGKDKAYHEMNIYMEKP